MAESDDFEFDSSSDDDDDYDSFAYESEASDTCGEMSKEQSVTAEPMTKSFILAWGQEQFSAELRVEICKCLVCEEEALEGVLLACEHEVCLDCNAAWIKARLQDFKVPNCPQCSRHLGRVAISAAIDPKTELPDRLDMLACFVPNTHTITACHRCGRYLVGDKGSQLQCAQCSTNSVPTCSSCGNLVHPRLPCQLAKQASKFDAYLTEVLARFEADSSPTADRQLWDDIVVLQARAQRLRIASRMSDHHMSYLVDTAEMRVHNRFGTESPPELAWRMLRTTEEAIHRQRHVPAMERREGRPRMHGVTQDQDLQGDVERIEMEAEGKPTELVVRNCPGEGCGITIERRDGCDTMRCSSCNSTFCWRCGKLRGVGLCCMESVATTMAEEAMNRSVNDARPMDDARLMQDAQPMHDVQPMDDARPMHDAQPMHDARPMLDAQPMDDARPMLDAQPMDGPQPMHDAHSMHDAQERGPETQPAPAFEEADSNLLLDTSSLKDRYATLQSCVLQLEDTLVLEPPEGTFQAMVAWCNQRRELIQTRKRPYRNLGRRAAKLYYKIADLLHGVLREQYKATGLLPLIRAGSVFELVNASLNIKPLVAEQPIYVLDNAQENVWHAASTLNCAMIVLLTLDSDQHDTLQLLLSEATLHLISILEAILKTPQAKMTKDQMQALLSYTSGVDRQLHEVGVGQLKWSLSRFKQAEALRLPQEPLELSDDRVLFSGEYGEWPAYFDRKVQARAAGREHTHAQELVRRERYAEVWQRGQVNIEAWQQHAARAHDPEHRQTLEAYRRVCDRQRELNRYAQIDPPLPARDRLGPARQTGVRDVR